MATRALQAEEPAGNILHKLGLFRARAPQATDEAPSIPVAAIRTDPRVRRRLLNEIRDFLLDHDLEVTPMTLSAALDACSGANPRLERRIERRKESGDAITQGWLEEVTASDSRSDDRSVEELAKKLERGIEELSNATRNVRRATTEYGDELERRVDDLQGSHQTEEMIAQLADFAKAMLVRSRQTEEELRANERETAALRKNLDRARRDAELDYLTGLPNRRAFEEVLAAENAEAQKAGRPLSVAFCDIDRFKSVNDSHGHEAGDRIIRAVADTLSSLCGRDCYIARHGGEEFVMLFRGMTPEDAYEQLDGARQELASRRMINRRTDKPFGVVTFSGGIADVARYRDPREALAAADEALYRAKDEGRNQIRLA